MPKSSSQQQQCTFVYLYHITAVFLSDILPLTSHTSTIEHQSGQEWLELGYSWYTQRPTNWKHYQPMLSWLVKNKCIWLCIATHLHNTYSNTSFYYDFCLCLVCVQVQNSGPYRRKMTQISWDYVRSWKDL